MMVVPPPPYDDPVAFMAKRKPHDPALATVTLSLRSRLAMLAEALDLLAGAEGANAAAAAAALRNELGKITLSSGPWYGASSSVQLPGPTPGVNGWRRWREWAAAIIQRTAAAGKSSSLAALVKRAAQAALGPIAADATVSGVVDGAARLVARARGLLKTVIKGKWKESKLRLQQARDAAARAARGAGAVARKGAGVATTAAAAAGGAAGGGAVVATSKVADKAAEGFGKALPWILGALGLGLGVAAYVRSSTSAGGA